jgi:adenine phosphoribosyltransferase
MSESAERWKALIRNVPDFPKPGIVFKDLTPLLADAEVLAQLVAGLSGAFERGAVDIVLGPESRGFIFGAAVADRLGAGFVPARKPGKLPWNTLRAEYALEYGTDALEIHTDAIRPGQRVLIVDDVLATGGTAAAACELVHSSGGVIVGAAFVVELGFLHGRAKLPDTAVRSLMVFD